MLDKKEEPQGRCGSGPFTRRATLDLGGGLSGLGDLADGLQGFQRNARQLRVVNAQNRGIREERLDILPLGVAFPVVNAEAYHLGLAEVVVREHVRRRLDQGLLVYMPAVSEELLRVFRDLDVGPHEVARCGRDGLHERVFVVQMWAVALHPRHTVDELLVRRNVPVGRNVGAVARSMSIMLVHLVLHDQL